MSRWRCALVVSIALVAAGCAGDATADGPSAGRGPEPAGVNADGPATTAAPTTTAYQPTTTAPPPDLRTVAAPTCPSSVDDATFRAPDVGRAPSTTEPKPTTTTSTASPPKDASTTTAPTDLAGAIDRFVHDPRLTGDTVSASLWMEGKGEVVTQDPDSLRIPASNEKLITGIGAFNLLDLDERLHTDVVATGPITDGDVHGDLVLVGGGDPVLQRAGPDSLDELARRIADARITHVDGQVLVDESRYDTVRAGQNWPNDWLSSIGPMSALGVDHDMVTKDPVYVADPALGNGKLMRFALGAHGVIVDGGVDHGRADEGVRVASVESPTIRELLGTMLMFSDNFIAESLTKEIGYRQSHAPGTTAAGLDAIHRVVTDLCVPITGVAVDGSGLSRDDRRTVHELRRLLQVAEVQPWGDGFVSALSISGEKDSLGGRLAGPDTAGKVRAKGGFLFAAKSLSGYLLTTDGRHVVFSIIVNGDLSSPRNKADPAIDDFLTDVARLPA